MPVSALSARLMLFSETRLRAAPTAVPGQAPAWQLPPFNNATYAMPHTTPYAKLLGMQAGEQSGRHCDMASRKCALERCSCPCRRYKIDHDGRLACSSYLAMDLNGSQQSKFRRSVWSVCMPYDLPGTSGHTCEASVRCRKCLQIAPFCNPGSRYRTLKMVIANVEICEAGQITPGVLQSSCGECKTPVIFGFMLSSSRHTSRQPMVSDKDAP